MGLHLHGALCLSLRHLLCVNVQGDGALGAAELSELKLIFAEMLCD